MSENYASMRKGQKEAKIGLESEKDIINMINTNDDFKRKLKGCLKKLGFDVEEISSAYKGKKGAKTDIIIVTNGEKKIGVSIKSTTKTSFHQLDRRWLKNWEKFLKMPDDIVKIINEAILRVAKDRSAQFILDKDKMKIKEFFKKHLDIVIREIFRKDEENLKLLMINDKSNRKLYIFRMNDVISFLINDAKNNLCFSQKGIFYLGNFISMQRKGGDGHHITVPKTDPMHPGNQLQFKFSPLNFAKYIEETGTTKIDFCVINY